MLDEIILGDCFTELPKFKENSFSCAFTSPPYNRKRNDKYTEYNDAIDDYYAFLCNFTDELLRVTNKIVAINIQKTFYNKEEVFRWIGKYSDKIQEYIVTGKQIGRASCRERVSSPV